MERQAECEIYLIIPTESTPDCLTIRINASRISMPKLTFAQMSGTPTSTAYQICLALISRWFRCWIFRNATSCFPENGLDPTLCCTIILQYHPSSPTIWVTNKCFKQVVVRDLVRKRFDRLSMTLTKRAKRYDNTVTTLWVVTWACRTTEIAQVHRHKFSITAFFRYLSVRRQPPQ